MLVIDNDFNTFIQVTLKAIQRDISYIRKDMKKVEEAAYKTDIRANKIESSFSFIRGGFYVFIALFSIILASVSMR